MVVRQHSFYIEDALWTQLRHHCLDANMSVSAYLNDLLAKALGEPKLIATPSEAAEAAPYNPLRAVPKPARKK